MGRLDRGLYFFFPILVNFIPLPPSQLDSQFISYYRIRAHRVTTRGSNVVRVLSGRPGVVRGGRDAGTSHHPCLPVSHHVMHPYFQL